MRPRQALLWAEKSAAAGSYCRVRRTGSDTRKAWFYWVFLHGTALAEKSGTERAVGRVRAALLEFRHVICSGRCVVGHRCPQGADIVEIVVAQSTGVSQNATSAFDLPSSNASASTGSGTGSGGAAVRIDFAGDHERAARRTEPVLGGIDDRHPTSRSAALKDLFAQIDGDGDGKISKSEFENALGAGGTNLAQADSVFGKLDKDGDGSVSLKEMASALKGGKGHHHHQCMTDGRSGGSDGSNSDPLLQALQGASSTSVTNSDGSVTTSLTYADGSKVTMTSAASGSSSSAATSSYNFIEQMIQRQAQGDFIGAPPHRFRSAPEHETRIDDAPSEPYAT